MTDAASDLATDLQMLSINKIIYLRDQMKAALAALDDKRPSIAGDILKEALKQTDFGEMKIWQPDEQPF